MANLVRRRSVLDAPLITIPDAHHVFRPHSTNRRAPGNLHVRCLTDDIGWYNPSMKTAISLPDELGHAADLFAFQRDMSRSELYAKALSEYLAKHRGDDLTERINAAMARINEKDERVGESGLGAIRGLEW
jgi:predicted transcriptional regulator